MRKPLNPNQLRPGDKVRGLRILQRLNAGGFAFVFRVERGGRHYTLKMAALPASDEKDMDRVDAWMRREVNSLEHLEHPSLLPVLEWGRWPDSESGYAYYVTPHISGSTFHVWRWRQRASLDRVVGVLCELLEALEMLHARGMCHRDLKADNLLVQDGNDRAFVLDFGAAHLPCARPLTEGLAPGTLYCQPPEAISFLVNEAWKEGSRLEARPSADLYTVGILLYEALTLCYPFNPKLPLEQLLVAIASRPPPEPRQLVPGAPASLCDLTLRLLASAPEQRPPSARAVREELERLRKEEGTTAAWQAPPPRPPDRAQVRECFPSVDVLEVVREEAADLMPLHVAGEAAASGRTERSGGWLKRFLVLALGLGVLGLGWMLFREEPPAPQENGFRAESTAPVAPAPSEKGSPSVPSFPTVETPATPAASRLCVLLTSLLGVASSQLAGCATTPVRPDPVRYLSRCSPEARATPVKLGLEPDENASFFDTGVPASEDSIEQGGSLNLRPGRVNATMFAYVKGKEQEFKVSGNAVTTPKRVYIEFDQLHLPDGSTLPICGVAVDGIHQYGIPTYAAVAIPGGKVDPARVDKSPGSVVLNDPRFEIVLQGPEGYPLPRIRLAPPDWR
jgi:serine/threonine-protein kinase